MKQQRDCGCGSVRAPTVEETLAIARAQGLPIIRERHPPRARVAASMKGWVSWALVDRSGSEIKGGEGPNLILNQGLDQVATHMLLREIASDTSNPIFPIMTYAAVGTDNTTPAVAQTGLIAEVGRVNTLYTDSTLQRPSNGVYRLTRYFEFDYAVGNGNLTEWGVSYASAAGGNLFNRALFLDGGGSPEVVTNTTDYKLRLIYTLEIALSPVTLTAASFDITGVGTVTGSYTLVGSSAPTAPDEVGNAPDLKLFSHLARGLSGTTTGVSQRPEIGSLRALDADMSGVAYTNAIGVISDNTALMVAREISASRDAYTIGSYARAGGAWKFDTQYGNLDPLRAFGINGASGVTTGGSAIVRYGYVFDLAEASEFVKDDEHTLTIGAPTVSWARA